MPPHAMDGPRRAPMPMPMQRPPMPTYNSDYGPAPPLPPHGQYLNVHPQPRLMNSSPVMPYEQPPQFSYRPGPMRSDPGVNMPPPMQPQYAPPRQPDYGPPPPRAGYLVEHCGPPRPGYAGYGPMPPQQYMHPAHRPPPAAAGSSMMPMAHSMFHNAACLARQLPQRSDTPLTESGPPSSDPPSSGTATSPSSPATPKDLTTIHVAVDPLFIDPTLADLPDSSSEPALPHKYFEYADGLDKAAEEPEIDVPHPSVPPTGFVQRVRAMLESRAAVEEAQKKEAERERAGMLHSGDRLAARQGCSDEVSELVELAANETPRFTIIEEFEAPVELPASPVKIAELSSSPKSVKVQHRLTRELVKAELAETSALDDCTSTDGEATEVTELGAKVELHCESSKHATSSKQEASSTETHASSKLSPDSAVGTPEPRHKQSIPMSAKSASPDIISGIDYALRFSVPIDTTAATDETQSRDPFMLDADTITLAHQRSIEQVRSAGPPIDAAPNYEEEQQTTVSPVSPMPPGEDVSRCSAVSPLNTQPLGTDGTLRLASPTKTTESAGTGSERMLEAASSTEGSLPPPTPRTPKTYSKSVPLPHTSSTATDTPSTHRYSLPSELSTVADTTMANTNSDMITDVAVRFSLPNTTVSIGRPQIVTIPPSSSPEPPESPPPRSTARNLEPRSARRNSVTFADEVAPLPLSIRKAEPRREAAGNEPYNKTKSIMRRPLPLEDIAEFKRPGSEREANNVRLGFPGNGLNGRFGSTHLPGLKEESVEDMSIHENQKRSSSRNDSQQLMLPARIAAVKAMQERRLQESAEKAKARRAARHHNRTLTEIRDLPSLNFSRMDLIDKLNQALEVRPSKSMEVVRRRDFSAIYCPSPLRPQSTEPLRERYTSFFSKPEDFGSFMAQDEQLGEVEGEEPVAVQSIPDIEVQESTKLELVSERGGSRPLSPQDFLNVANQVNRLSIPSVTGLSEKLTNMLPALRNLQLDSVLANEDEVVEDVHHIEGLASRPGTVLSTRTSAGFRTLAERAEEIVKNGTHDSMVPPSRLLLDKELPPLPESASADKVSATISTDGKQSYLSGSFSAPSDLGKDPARPASALIHQRSPLTEQEVRELLPPEMNPITRSKRSLVVSSASRPWNQDENYPWAGTNVPVDLCMPTDTHARDGPQRHKSTDLTSTVENNDDSTQGIDIGSILTTIGDGTASITTEQATGVPSASSHARKHSKRSIIGNITKKISLTAHQHHRSKPTTNNSGLAEDSTTSLPGLTGPSEGSLPHKPGDRYPTTALMPPVNLHLDEVRSFFSDDSSEKARRDTGSGNATQTLTFRRRFTNFRHSNKHHSNKTTRTPAGRLNATRGATSLDGAAGLSSSTEYDAGSVNAERERAASAGAGIEGVGMGKAEFRIRRLGERLRVFLARGGELIRSFSTRAGHGRRGGDGEDWLGDEVYEGV